MAAVTSRISHLAGLSPSLQSLLCRSRPLVYFGRFGASAVLSRRIDVRSLASTPNPPKPPNPQRDQKSNANKNPAATPEGRTKHSDVFQYPLPENWVRITPEDWAHITSYFEQLLHTPPVLKELQLLSTIVGAPKELKQVLDLMKEPNALTIQNVIKLNTFHHIVFDRARELGVELKPDTIKSEIQVASKIAGAPRSNVHPSPSAKKHERPTPKADQKPANQAGAGSQGQKQSNGGQKPNQDNNNQAGNQKSNRRLFLEVSAVTLTWLILAYAPNLFSSSSSLSWQDVRKNYLEKGLVQRFIVYNNSVVAILHHPENIENPKQEGTFSFTPRVKFSIASRDAFEKNLNQAQDELDIPSSDRIPVEYAKQSIFLPFLWQFGPTLLLIALLVYARSGATGRGGDGGIFGITKSRAKIYSETGIKVRFADVAGLDESKVEIMEFVSFLKNPAKFERLGARIPRGAILSGPPGTGKTMLAKATAGECGVPFFSVSGSEFVEVFVGVGPSRVRDLFAMARKNTPCIIFIDEIDAIGRSRQSDSRFGGNSEREATLNQILTEMDGFNTQEKVVVLAGTNRADVLDKALLRPGRFDRHIYIDRPTMKGRIDIFKVHLKKIKTEENIDELVGKLASMTPGFSGADIANVVNEAALIGELF